MRGLVFVNCTAGVWINITGKEIQRTKSELREQRIKFFKQN